MEKLTEDQKLMIVMRETMHLLHRTNGRRPTQERILFLLNREEMSQKKLQDTLKIAQGSLSELIIKMERNGLVTKRKDPSDQRRVLLALSAEGKKQAIENHRHYLSDDQGLFQILKNDEKNELMDILSKLNAEWSEKK